MLSALDCFIPPRVQRVLPRPTQEFAHLYTWIGYQWVAVVPQPDAGPPSPGQRGV